MKKVILTLITCLLLFSSCSLIKDSSGGAVKTGLDVISENDFQSLRDKKIALISNHSAIDRNGRHILDLMLENENVELKAIFAPEHGFMGRAETKVKDSRDESTGLPIYSLYGENLRPTREQLKDVDTLIFDIQDIGTRFYTYIGTMAMCMEEAAKNNIDFMVLDRPNPISGLRVAGPIQQDDLLKRFTSYFPMPIIHGMTVGELARMFNEFYGIQCNLEVVEMEGWKRTMYFDETGLVWVNPSPNIRNVKQAILYPGIALTEAHNSNVSVGRGTAIPFEIIGAPWIDAEKLTAEMNSRNIQGVNLLPWRFTPESSKFQGEECQGFKVEITDRSSLDVMELGLNMLSALYELYPNTYKIDPNYGLVGSKDVIERIKKGQPVDLIRASYREDLSRFIDIRNRFLLYKM